MKISLQMLSRDHPELSLDSETYSLVSLGEGARVVINLPSARIVCDAVEKDHYCVRVEAGDIEVELITPEIAEAIDATAITGADQEGAITAVGKPDSAGMKIIDAPSPSIEKLITFDKGIDFSKVPANFTEDGTANVEPRGNSEVNGLPRDRNGLVDIDPYLQR